MTSISAQCLIHLLQILQLVRISLGLSRRIHHSGIQVCVLTDTLLKWRLDKYCLVLRYYPGLISLLRYNIKK